MASSIAKTLARNLGSDVKDSYWDAYTVISENSVSNSFAEKFEINGPSDLGKFHQAFRLCTEGQGNELKYINNVTSSALLPLLTFFRLFGEKSGFTLNLRLTINGESVDFDFDRCFFEIRNKVIKLPSCVDVALYSSTQKVMLFLESKLAEYLKTTNFFKIKKGYAKLYSNKDFQDILSSGEVFFDGTKLKLKNGEKAYFEGIKQSISHLIGLVQGPSQNRRGVYYPKDYHEAYEKCYEEANTLLYGTIILNPNKIGASEANADYDNYVKLYTNIIGAHGNDIVKCIRHWLSLKGENMKEIKVLSQPLDYHDVFKNSTNLLCDEVMKFYKFEDLVKK